MTSKFVLATALVLSLVSGQAFAEGEGNGDPFFFHANGQVTDGRAVVADTGQARYPDLTGNSAQPSSLAQLEPAFGNEAPIQTASSLPSGSGDGTVAYAQAQGVKRHLAARPTPARVVEARTLRFSE